MTIRGRAAVSYTHLDVYKRQADEGIDVRVVSMPSMDVFDRQVKEYQEKVLPNAVRKRCLCLLYTSRCV